MAASNLTSDLRPILKAPCDRHYYDSFEYGQPPRAKIGNPGGVCPYCEVVRLRSALTEVVKTLEKDGRFPNGVAAIRAVLSGASNG